jgi:hypothetical protein
MALPPSPNQVDPPDGEPASVAECAVHSGTPSVSTCPRCGRFCCDDCRPLAAEPCPECAARQVKPRRFGGWLILAFLALIAYPVRFVATLATEAVSISRAGLAALVDPSLYVRPADLYLNHWNALSSLGMAAIALRALPRFLAKRRSTPEVMQTFFVANFLLNTVNSVLNAAFPASNAAPPPGSTAGPFVSSIVITWLWLRYFGQSPRVKETFIR